MIRFSLLMVCVILMGSAQTPSTTDWRGLAPIKSTRMDVERMLGPPRDTIKDKQMTYFLSDASVYLSFNGNPKCKQKLDYTSWDVPPDTLTEIDVYLRQPNPPLVEETGIDLTKYKKMQGDFDLVGRYIYVNDDGSFAIEVQDDHVAGYHYRPGSQQKDLRCERTTQR